MHDVIDQRGDPSSAPPGVVRIPMEPGVWLEADFYPPPAAPAPILIMGHGLGAERTFGLPEFARVFQDAGYAVLLMDYRGFGGSGGEPRLLVDGRRHARDMEWAFDFAATLPGVDPRGRILWGVSFGGGHALTVAAQRSDVAAVLAVVPHVDGLPAALKFPPRYLLPAIWMGLRDAFGALRGAEPIRVPLVDPDGLAVLATRDAWEGYLAILPDDVSPDRRVPARIFLSILTYRPGRLAGQVGCPVLVQAAARDTLIPLSAVRRAASRMERGVLRSYPVGHFDPYHEPWRSRFLEDQLAFLRDHVPPPEA